MYYLIYFSNGSKEHLFNSECIPATYNKSMSNKTSSTSWGYCNKPIYDNSTFISTATSEVI